MPLEYIPAPMDERSLADALEGIPVSPLDVVQVPYFGGRLDFKVVGLASGHEIPAGESAAYLVTQKTIFKIVDTDESQISIKINEYVRQDFGTDYTQNDAKGLVTPFLIGFELELSFHGITESIDYEKRLILLKVKIAANMSSKYKEIAIRSVEEANRNIASTNDMVSGEPVRNENVISSKQKKKSQMLNELKYAIIMKWSEIKDE